MTLRLRPLRDDELPAYLNHTRADYARDMAEQAGLSVEAAQRKAEADWARLLPGGTVPPGNDLLAVEDAETGERVGDVWLAEREGESGPAMFIYAIEVFPEFRGRGFGREAMTLVEDAARSRGLGHVNLTVLGGNDVARSLYRALGYTETAVFMGKSL